MVNEASARQQLGANKSARVLMTPSKPTEVTYQDIKATPGTRNDDPPVNPYGGGLSKVVSTQNLHQGQAETGKTPNILKSPPPLFSQAKKAGLSAKTLQNVFSSFENPRPTAKVFKVTIDAKSYRFDSNKYYKTYSEESRKPKKVVKCTPLGDGKIQKVYDNNSTEMVLPTGARRETFSNGYSIVHFPNGDIKQTLPDGSMIYYHGEQEITHITLQGEKGQV